MLGQNPAPFAASLQSAAFVQGTDFFCAQKHDKIKKIKDLKATRISDSKHFGLSPAASFSEPRNRFAFLCSDWVAWRNEKFDSVATSQSARCHRCSLDTSQLPQLLVLRLPPLLQGKRRRVHRSPCDISGEGGSPRIFKRSAKWLALLSGFCGVSFSSSSGDDEEEDFPGF